MPVVIVGAGVAGLAAAWRLLRANFRQFVILELEPVAGGTARHGTEGIVPHPWGAHYLPAPMKDNRALITLLDEMGILEGHDDQDNPVFAEQVLCRDPQERVFYRGRWYEGLYLHAAANQEDLAQRQRFEQEINRWVAWRDARGRRAFALPRIRGSEDPEVTALDRLSFADWLDRRGLTSPPLRWLTDYACRDDYGCHADDTSAWAGLFYFASRRRVPGDNSQPLLTWPEGNGKLVDHLTHPLKGRLRRTREDGGPLCLNSTVLDLHPTDPAGRKGVEVIAVEEKSQRLLGFQSDQVICAVPQFVVDRIFRPYRDHRPAYRTDFEYGAWMVANLHLRDRPALHVGKPYLTDRTGRSAGDLHATPVGDFPLAWDNVLYDSPSLGYVVATHQRGLDHGQTIFTYYHALCDANPRHARSRLFEGGREEWAEAVLTDLESAHGDIRELTERLDVMRWGHAMIRPRPGFLWSQALQRARRPRRGVHFAHSDLSGLALFEEAFDHGLRAAEEVLKERDVPFTTLR